MPLASIVGTSCFGTVFVGAVLILINQDLRPRYKRRRLRLPGHVVGCFLGGGAMMVWGILSLYCAYRSPILEATGTIDHVRPGTSRSSHPGPTFDILIEDGSSLHFSSAEQAIYRMEGERARISFSSYDNDLLDLQVVSGSDTGYRLHRSPSYAVYWSLAFIGLAIIVGTYRSLPRKE